MASPSEMSARAEVEAHLMDLNPEALFADGLDGALIGIASRPNLGPVALYDRDRCREVLVRDNEMTETEAEEWLSYNVTGAWMGPGTPIFCELIPAR